jgi:hypothetical protein
MKIEILHYLREKYFKIYSLKIFAAQKKSLIGPNPARGPPYADRCSKETPKTYYKIINETKNAKNIVKPISLLKMNIFN